VSSWFRKSQQAVCQKFPFGRDNNYFRAAGIRRSVCTPLARQHLDVDNSLHHQQEVFSGRTTANPVANLCQYLIPKRSEREKFAQSADNSSP
jgi:hypothetical protein